jgi:hypothetical protein
MDELIRGGAENCVVDCARVRKGNQVYIVNQKGAVEEPVSDVIQQIVEREEAKAIVIWENAIAKGSSEIPCVVLDASPTGTLLTFRSNKNFRS